MTKTSWTKILIRAPFWGCGPKGPEMAQNLKVELLLQFLNNNSQMLRLYSPHLAQKLLYQNFDSWFRYRGAEHFGPLILLDSLGKIREASLSTATWQKCPGGKYGLININMTYLFLGPILNLCIRCFKLWKFFLKLNPVEFFCPP